MRIGCLTASVLAFALMAVVIERVVAQESLDRLEKLLDEEAAAPARPVPKPEPPPRLAPIPADPKITTTARPGYLGVYAIEVDGQLVVEAVRPGSAAEAAKFRPGDQILRIGGAPLATLDEMSEVLDPLTAGTQLSVMVKRDGRELSLLATLTERPSSPAIKAMPNAVAEPTTDSFHALKELESLLDRAPPDDARPLAKESDIAKRVSSLQAELDRLNARIATLEETLRRVEAAPRP